MMKFNKTATPKFDRFAQREPGMVRNTAGGFAFQVDDWKQLERFLVLGTSGGTFYIDERQLTDVNVDAIERCLDADAERAIRTVVDISRQGRALRNDPALYVLALAAARKAERVIAPRDGREAFTVTEPSVASRLALEALPKVARTFTDLSHFVTYVRKPKLRGWGNGFMKGVARWYNDMPVEKLALQVVKYGSRDGVSQRDVYDLSHPARWTKPDAVRRAIFDFIVDGRMPSAELASHPALRLLAAHGEANKEDATGADVARLITTQGLPMEAVPTHLKSAEVYEAVLSGVLTGRKGNTLTWLVRNLGNLGAKGLLSDARPDIVSAVCAVLTDGDALKEARIHPLALLKALLAYRQGHGEKGRGQWPVIGRVVDALDLGFYRSFQYVEPSGKRLMLAVDVSGSMWGQRLTAFPSLSTHEAAAVMALTIANVEPNWSLVTFDTVARPCHISPRQRMDDVVKAMCREQGGGTDLASSIAYARRKRIPVDAFVLLTDYETWAGRSHSHRELELYRREMNIPARVVNIAMTPNSYTVAPPNDPLFLEVVGFDTQVPAVISAFLAE
ncbi:MAG TPA: TROVE domain-containing protein [Candidatus Obscuribacterales bacterium]